MGHIGLWGIYVYVRVCLYIYIYMCVCVCVCIYIVYNNKNNNNNIIIFVLQILEKSIKILFTTRDISAVKCYVQHQCQKLMEGNVSIQDCVFAKEYRGMSGYRPGACVPALQIAKYVFYSRTHPTESSAKYMLVFHMLWRKFHYVYIVYVNFCEKV